MFIIFAFVNGVLIPLLLKYWSYFLDVFLHKKKLYLYFKKGMMLEYELENFLKERYIKNMKFIHPEYLHKKVCHVYYQSKVMLFKVQRERFLKSCVFNLLLSSEFYFLIIIPQCFKVTLKIFYINSMMDAYCREFC